MNDCFIVYIGCMSIKKIDPKSADQYTLDCFNCQEKSRSSRVLLPAVPLSHMLIKETTCPQKHTISIPKFNKLMALFKKTNVPSVDPSLKEIKQKQLFQIFSLARSQMLFDITLCFLEDPSFLEITILFICSLFLSD